MLMADMTCFKRFISKKVKRTAYHCFLLFWINKTVPWVRGFFMLKCSFGWCNAYTHRIVCLAISVNLLLQFCKELCDRRLQPSRLNQFKLAKPTYPLIQTHAMHQTSIKREEMWHNESHSKWMEIGDWLTLHRLAEPTPTAPSVHPHLVSSDTSEDPFPSCLPFTASISLCLIMLNLSLNSRILFVKHSSTKANPWSFHLSYPPIW